MNIYVRVCVVTVATIACPWFPLRTRALISVSTSRVGCRGLTSLCGIIIGHKKVLHPKVTSFPEGSLEPVNKHGWSPKTHCLLLCSAQLSRVILILELPPPQWISTFPSAQIGTSHLFWKNLSHFCSESFSSILSMFPPLKIQYVRLYYGHHAYDLFLLFSYIYIFFSTIRVIGSQYLPRNPYFYFQKNCLPKFLCSP